MSANRSVTAHFVARYTLTASASPSHGGTVTGGGTYAPNSAVTVTASPRTGYRFDRWSGACTGSGTCSVTMTADRAVTAHFVARYTLTTGASPSGGGTVTGGGTYDDGTNVTVTAAANLGYRFVEWSGACLGTGACTVAMNGDRAVTATFEVGPVYTLTARAQPAAGGTVTGGGRYNGGTNVTVTATANSGYRFSHWTGGACSGSGACSVGMTRNRLVVAVFVAQYNLRASTFGSGVLRTPNGDQAAGTYDAGTVVTVVAIPNPGHRFTEWGEACTGTGACSVTMNGDRTVEATFVPVYTLTTTASPAGGGTLTGGGAYDEGASATVTATPNAGYVFERWSGDCTGTGACSVTMTAARSVTAHFARVTYTVHVRAQPLLGGTVSGGGSYDSGTRVTIAATPEAGYRFEAWSGAGAGRCGTSSSCTFTLSGNRLFIARFVRVHTLTATADPSAGGTVTGGGTHDAGTDVTVTATPNAGYRFDRWSGDCTGTGACARHDERGSRRHGAFRAHLDADGHRRPIRWGERRPLPQRRHVRRRDRRHGDGDAERRLPLRALVGRLHGHGGVLRDHDRRPLGHRALHRPLHARHERRSSRRGERLRRPRVRHQRHRLRRPRVRFQRRRRRHRHAERGLPFRPLVGRLHGHGRLYRDHERRPLGDGALRPQRLHAHRQRLALPRGERHRRRRLRSQQRRHRHGQPERRLRLRPLVRRLYGLRNLLRDHERRPLRHGALRRALHAHRQRLAVRRRERHRRRNLRRRDERDGHGHGEPRLPLPGMVGGLSGHGGLHGHDERGPLRHRRLRRRSRLHAHRESLARRRGNGHGRGPLQRRDRRHGHGHGEQRLPLQPLDRRLLRLRRLLRQHDAQPPRYRRLRRAV